MKMTVPVMNSVISSWGGEGERRKRGKLKRSVSSMLFSTDYMKLCTEIIITIRYLFSVDEHGAENSKENF